MLIIDAKNLTAALRNRTIGRMAQPIEANYDQALRSSMRQREVGYVE